MIVDPTPISAGGVVVRESDGGVEILLVRQGGLWRLPKGMTEQAESLQETAVREVLEESGVRAAIVSPPLSQVGWTYEFQGIVCNEKCTFYLMVDVGLPYIDHDHETEEIAWRPAALAQLHYEVEQGVAELAIQRVARIDLSRIVITSGESTGIRTGRGRLALSRAEAEEMLGTNESVVLVLDSFSPRDAALIGHCAAVGSVREGPSSHVSVVAAALGVPCLTSMRVEHLSGALEVRDRAWVPAGALVEVDEASAQMSVVNRSESPDLPTAVSQEKFKLVTQANALDWATKVSSDFGLPAPVNWKVFKRDLLGRYFPTPQSQRFASPWEIDEVAAAAVDLSSGGQVRCSAFPRDIACHAVSVQLDTSSGQEIRRQLDRLNRSDDLELFVQQDSRNLSWRLVSNCGAYTIEAGVGQAMYVFEEERGGHPVAFATWSNSQYLRYGGDAETQELLRQLLERYQTDLAIRANVIADDLSLDVFAVEGYFSAREGSYVTVDMDLPFDWVFMSSASG